MVKSPIPSPASTVLDVHRSAALVRAGSSSIRDLLEITEQPHVLSLAGGLPHPGTFPTDAIAAAAAAAITADPIGALQYGPTEGYRPLRGWVAGRHGLGTDTDADADADADAEAQVTITSGSQQAIELLARAMVDPGAVVALADPAYVGALQAFRAAGAQLAPIASDHEGLRVDDLADQLRGGLRPTLVYVVANFDNPTGSTLSAERRQHLGELSDRYGFWIIDDDPYGDLRWSGSAPPPLRTTAARVVTLGSTSKVLCPGLRVGWAVGPAPLLRNLTILKQAADLHTSALTQQIVHRTLTTPGFLDEHLATLRATYEAQARVLTTALGNWLGDAIEFQVPDGGMFIWARLTEASRDSANLLSDAIAAGVAFVPGAAFSVTAGHRDRMRLSFATNSPTDLATAVERLAGVLDSAEAQ